MDLSQAAPAPQILPHHVPGKVAGRVRPAQSQLYPEHGEPDQDPQAAISTLGSDRSGLQAGYFCAVKQINPAIARELSLAVYDLSLESRESTEFHELTQDLKNAMGATSDIRSHLGDDSVKVRFGNNRKFVTMGDVTVELPADATHEEVAAALNVTTMPVNQMKPMEQATTSVAVAEPLKRNVTGAAGLGSSVEKLIAAIKGEVDAAHSELHAAAGEVRTGINTVKGVAKALKTEADDIKSKLGQFSNGGPE